MGDRVIDSNVQSFLKGEIKFFHNVSLGRLVSSRLSDSCLRIWLAEDLEQIKEMTKSIFLKSYWLATGLPNALF